MALDQDQQIRMALGGTTGLPAPYPTIGSIRLDDPQDPPTGSSIVLVSFSQTPDKAIIWSVMASDITAIEERKTLQKFDADGDPIVPKWHVGETAVLAALAAAGAKPLPGIAYVREETQVLLKLEYGLSAIDSVGIALRRGSQADGDVGASCTKPCCE